MDKAKGKKAGSGRPGPAAPRREEGTLAGTHRLLCYCSKHLSQAEGPGAGGAGSGLSRRRVYSALQQEIQAAVATAAAVAVAQQGVGQHGMPQGGAPPLLRGSAYLASLWPPGGASRVPETITHAHGSARCVPLDSRRSRGLREPDSIARAEAKRLYVQRTPYLVTGCIGRAPLPLPQVRVTGSIGGLLPLIRGMLDMDLMANPHSTSHGF